MYRLELGNTDISPPNLEEEGTLAKAIAPDPTAVAVTFSAECADEFLSVHHLAPGNPLIEDLIKMILKTDDGPERLRKMEESETGFDLPILSGWGRKETLAAITENGTVSEKVFAQCLSEWVDEFIDNRALSHPD